MDSLCWPSSLSYSGEKNCCHSLAISGCNSLNFVKVFRLLSYAFKFYTILDIDHSPFLLMEHLCFIILCTWLYLCLFKLLRIFSGTNTFGIDFIRFSSTLSFKQLIVTYQPILPAHIVLIVHNETTSNFIVAGFGPSCKDWCTGFC